MPRVVGVDPGTAELRPLRPRRRRVFLEASDRAPTTRAGPRRRWWTGWRPRSPLDLIAAPSGYGLPLRPRRRPRPGAARPGRPRARPEDRHQPERVGGLRAMVELMRDRGLPAVLLPGVVHLDTVPAAPEGEPRGHGHRRQALRRRARHLGPGPPARGSRPRTTAFVLLELGGFFTAALAVDRGRIVDGIGGSAGGLGYRALGTLDGEVAYALGRVRKSTLFTGGAAFVAGAPDLRARGAGRPARPATPGPGSRGRP